MFDYFFSAKIRIFFETRLYLKGKTHKMNKIPSFYLKIGQHRHKTDDCPILRKKRRPMVIPFLVMMKQVKFLATGTPRLIHSLFFSALPAPVPLYFDGVTLKR